MAAPRSASRTGARAGGAAKASIPQVPWHQIRPAPVLLVSGSEQFLADRALRAIRDLLRVEDPSLEVTDIEADGYAAGELFTLASPSLFGEPRLVRVSAVEKASDAFIEDALAYLAAPADGATIVLRHGGGNRGKKLLDAIRSGTGGGVEVVCAELKKDAEKQEFAAAEFASAGRRISGTALRSLVSAFSDDLAELAAICQQLIADTTGAVDDRLVEKVTGGRVETNAFQVADSAIAGRAGEALVALRHALASGADPVPMVAAFAAKLRTMAKVGASSAGSGQIASQFGLAPWQVDRARRDLQGWDERGLGRAIELVAETDELVKGAARDQVYALERMVSVIARRGRE